jgi:hypothetical protein
VKRVFLERVNEIVRDAERTGNLIGVRLSACDGEEIDPWLTPPSRKERPEVIETPLPNVVRVTLGNLVYVDKKALPSAMLNPIDASGGISKPRILPCAGYAPIDLWKAACHSLRRGVSSSFRATTWVPGRGRGTARILWYPRRTGG